MMRMNPWRYNTPPGWNDIADAPRDGTVIETQNNWGVAPTFRLCHWVDGRWQIVNHETQSVGEGPHLSWRPYAKAIDDYVDPTRGAQDTANYWLLACGQPPRPTGDMSMDQEFRGTVFHPARSPSEKWSNQPQETKPDKRPGLFARLSAVIGLAP